MKVRIFEAQASWGRVLESLQDFVENCSTEELARADADKLEAIANDIRIRLEIEL